jgi:hypothetical protein
MYLFISKTATATILSVSLTMTSEAAKADSALASGDCGVLGMAQNLGSRNMAIAAAIQNCQNNGGQNCRLVFAFADSSCAAIASDMAQLCGGVWNWNTAATFPAAQALALSACSANGGKQCGPRGGVCNNPPPPPPTPPSPPMQPIDPGSAGHLVH